MGFIGQRQNAGSERNANTDGSTGTIIGTFDRSRAGRCSPFGFMPDKRSNGKATTTPERSRCSPQSSAHGAPGRLMRCESCGLALRFCYVALDNCTYASRDTVTKFFHVSKEDHRIVFHIEMEFSAFTRNVDRNFT
jgi:hypothetical protein